MISLYLYRCLSWLIPPLALIRGLGGRNSLALKRLAPDLSQAPAGGIWVHGLSVGEVGAAAAFIQAFRRAHPDQEILLSTSTAWGLSRAQKERAFVFPAPYDFYPLIKRVIARLRPRLFVALETDLWPNLLWGLKAAGVPLALINARISPASTRRLKRFPFLVELLYGAFDLICLPSKSVGDRLAWLGLKVPFEITGNIKYDLSPPDEGKISSLAQEFSFLGRPLIVPGNTHPGEEEILIEAFVRLRHKKPRASLILCPRHPERATELLAWLGQKNLPASRRSVPQRGSAVVVVDTMGELWAFYGLADLAFVGGTLVPLGGHNLLEPAALKVPVTFGPYVSAVKEVAEELVESGGGLKAREVSDLLGAWQRLLEGREKAGKAAWSVFRRHQGATARAVAAVGRLLS